MVVWTGTMGVSRRVRGNLTCAGVVEDTLSTSTLGSIPVAKQAELLTHQREYRHSLQSVPVS